MGAPRVNSFCGCLTLQFGAKFIGFIYLIASVFMSLLSSLFIVDTLTLVDRAQDSDSPHFTTLIVIIFVTIFMLMHVALAITLLVCIFKRHTSGLRAWLRLVAPLCVASFVSIMVFCIRREMTILPLVLSFGILIYFIVCVYSYYLMLKDA